MYFCKKKIRVSIIYVFSFFFLTYCFAQSLNIVRQMFGLSIGCFLIAEFYNKKISFVIFELSICFLCYLIHHSLLILGLFPIFVYFDFNKYCSEKDFDIIASFNASFIIVFPAIINFIFIRIYWCVG